MNIQFKTQQFSEATITTEHNNVPEDMTWYELTDIFWNHLNSCGYRVDQEAREVMFDALDNLMCARHYALIQND